MPDMLEDQQSNSGPTATDSRSPGSFQSFETRTPPPSERGRDARPERAIFLQIRLFLSVAIVLLLVGGVLFAYGWRQYSPLNASTMSQLGNYASGVVASVWSLASIMLIYVAFLGQRLQILHQQREFDVTKKQFVTQQFENTFFALINLHYSIVGSLEYQADSVDRVQLICTGREYFSKVVDILVEEFEKSTRAHTDSESAAVAAYDVVYRRFRSGLGHYFRHLYNIVKFIDQSSGVDKIRYVNLLRAQLSSNESLLLFYNCLHPKGHAKFYPLAVRYNLLESVPLEQLLSKDHFRLFPLPAYGERNRHAQGG